MKNTTGRFDLKDEPPRRDGLLGTGAGRGVAPLDHPLRREICIALQRQERGASELAEALDCHPPTLSHHLATLLAAGLVRVRVAGRRRFYSVVAAAALAAWEEYVEPSRARVRGEAA